MDTMEKQRVIITVKTDPTLSRKHGETVCTAGVRDDGSPGSAKAIDEPLSPGVG